MNCSKKNCKTSNLKRYTLGLNLSMIIIFLMSLLGNIQSTEAQLLKKLKKRSEKAAEEAILRKTERKVYKETSKKMDTILGNDGGKKKRKKGEKKNPKEKNPSTNQNSPGQEVPNDIKIYSKFDFVPGNKILLYDDFSLDNIGDFPSKWNTNGTGELVTINNKKWFLLAGKSIYIPELSIDVPENYTIEFDMLTDGLDKYTSSQAKLEVWLHDNNSFKHAKNMAKVEIPLAQYTSAGFEVRNSVDGERVIRSVIERDVREAILKETHVSIAVNGKRFRMWMNEKKIVDVPRLVPDNIVAFKLYPRSLRDGQDKVFTTNLKIAESGEDLRSQLLAKGKYSTTGILFNSGSDKIKPESYGVLKQIATALEQEPTMNLNIIGHTDSDGDDKNNFTLSERRAQSVKNMLIGQFNINESRLRTEGKGESEPLSDNSTTEGKANNRRVEFVKL